MPPILSRLLFLCLAFCHFVGFGQELPGEYKRERVIEEGKGWVKPDSFWVYHKTRFDRVRFDSSAYFRRAHFKSKANFRYARFDSLVYFRRAHFDARTYFRHAHFGSEAHFSRTKFKSKTYFTNARFDSLAYFGDSHFDSLVNFGGTQFLTKLNFEHAKVKGHMIFDFAGLPDTLDVWMAEISGEMDFTYAQLREGKDYCLLIANNTNIDNLVLDYRLFKVYFPPEDSLIKSAKEKVYNDLLMMQERHNFKDGYEKLYVEYMEFITGNSLTHQFRKHWNNYGYKKEWILRNTVVLLMLFFIPTLLSFRFLITEVYCPKSLVGLKEKLSAKPEDMGVVKQLLGTVVYAFYYTVIIFFGLKMELENFTVSGNYKTFNPLKKLGVAFIIATFLVGLLCTAYLANFIITD